MQFTVFSCYVRCRNAVVTVLVRCDSNGGGSGGDDDGDGDDGDGGDAMTRWQWDTHAGPICPNFCIPSPCHFHLAIG